MFQLEVTERAAADVDEAMAWWARNRSVPQAIRWYIGVRRAIRELADDPERFPIAAEGVGRPQDLREMHFGLGSRPTHRILFEIGGSIVRVITVQHTARDEVKDT